jgi:hypothetical protein
MVYFFGIFSPGKLKRASAEEAQNKANFFGGLPDIAQGAVPLSRAEQEACYLADKAPEPDYRDTANDRERSGEA